MQLDVKHSSIEYQGRQGKAPRFLFGHAIDAASDVSLRSHMESHTAATLRRSGREVVGSIPTWDATQFSVSSDKMAIFQVKWHMELEPYT